MKVISHFPINRVYDATHFISLLLFHKNRFFLGGECAANFFDEYDFETKTSWKKKQLHNSTAAMSKTWKPFEGFFLPMIFVVEMKNIVMCRKCKTCTMHRVHAQSQRHAECWSLSKFIFFSFIRFHFFQCSRRITMKLLLYTSGSLVNMYKMYSVQRSAFIVHWYGYQYIL